MRKLLSLCLVACLAAACGAGNKENAESNEAKLRAQGKKLGEYFCKMQSALQANNIDEMKKIRTQYSNELMSIHNAQQELAGKQEKTPRSEFMAAALKELKVGINETANACGVTKDEIETFFATSKLRGEPKED